MMFKKFIITMLENYKNMLILRNFSAFIFYKESKSIFNTLKYLIFVYFYLIYSIKYIKCLNVEKKIKKKCITKLSSATGLKKY